MVTQKKFSKSIHYFIPVLLLLIVVFISGFLLGKQLGNSDMNEISSFIKDNELQTESYLIEQELLEHLGKESCALSQHRLDSLSKELGALGYRLGGPTAEEDLGPTTYNFLKRKFHLLQIRVYTLYKQFKEQCDLSNSIVLYYYSQNDENSAAQGPILDQLVAEKGIYVFAIEYNYSSELNFLERYYLVSQTPFIVVDYEQEFSGLTSYETLLAALHDETS